MPDGIDAMEQDPRRRRKRNVPPPKHPKGTSTAATPPPAPPAPAGEPAPASGSAKVTDSEAQIAHSETNPPAPADHSAKGDVSSSESKRVANAALSWGAAVRKEHKRLQELLDALSAAPDMPPAVLRATLTEAEWRGGRPLPDSVWKRAGFESAQ